jgi:cell fate regulator YaaT (PSP1 superfamily)
MEAIELKKSHLHNHDHEEGDIYPPGHDNDSGQTEAEIEENSNSDDAKADQADQKKNSRFKNGDPIKLVRVRFPGNAKSHPFLVGKRNFAYGQKVIAMSDRGMSVGYINSFPYDSAFHESMLPLRSIAKVATEEDIKEQLGFLQKEKEAERLCLKLVDKYNLDMILTHVEYIQFGKKAVFYFTAPERVDFRGLVKDLVGDLKMRIELRQISVRDRTAALGSIGVCGLQTCCSTFLSKYGNVSIKMAKNQNLALIPTKLNGICGQTKCCIKYEDNVYADKRNLLPEEGTMVKVKNGDIGRVTKLHVLIEQFEMLTDRGVRRRYSINLFDKMNSTPPSTWSFPKEFDHITDESSEVLGLKVEEKIKAEQFDQEMQESN